MSNSRTVVVFFSRYHNLFSRFVYLASGGGYTHVSLSLDPASESYYSFNRKGFRRETPRFHKRMDGHWKKLYLEIPEDAYARMERRIEAMRRQENLYRYTRLGVLLCLLHIPVKLPCAYFCSQFVAELLQAARCVHLSKEASLYMPNQLERELRTLPCVSRVEYALGGAG